MKRCTKCRETKPETEYYRSDDEAGGLKGRCKECCIAAVKANREATRCVPEDIPWGRIFIVGQRRWELTAAGVRFEDTQPESAEQIGRVFR